MAALTQDAPGAGSERPEGLTLADRDTVQRAAPPSVTDAGPTSRPHRSLDLRITDTPARDLPNGLWLDILDVAQAHGLRPAPVEVMRAASALIDVTPIAAGGRRLSDGSLLPVPLPQLSAHRPVLPAVPGSPEVLTLPASAVLTHGVSASPVLPAS